MYAECCKDLERTKDRIKNYENKYNKTTNLDDRDMYDRELEVLRDKKKELEAQATLSFEDKLKNSIEFNVQGRNDLDSVLERATTQARAQEVVGVGAVSREDFEK